MTIPKLQIYQQSARINLNTIPPKLNIKQKKADMQVNQPAGKLEIKNRTVKVQVDNYPARYDLGIKNPVDMGKDYAAKGKKAVMESIQKYVSDGNRLMNFKNKSNTIAELAKEETYANSKVELGLKWKRGPSYKVESGQLKIKFKAQQPIIKTKLNPPVTDLDWGDVKISMTQYAEVDISLTGTYLSRMV